MKIYITFIIFFCSTIVCVGQNQTHQKVSRIRLSADDTTSFTPTSFKDTIVVDGSKPVPRMKTSAFDDEGELPLKNTTPIDSSTPTNSTKMNSGDEEEEPNALPKNKPQTKNP